MRPNRLMLVFLLSLIAVGSSYWAISRTADDALLLLRDGSIVAGELFVVNNQTISLLNEDGIMRYQRSDVSQVVFLTSRNILALRAEGRFVDDKVAEGSIFYLGGSWDGLPAGSFKSTLHHPTPDGMHDHLMLRTEFILERNGLSSGVLNVLVVGESLSESENDILLKEQLAGVILGGTGEYTRRSGVADVVVTFDLNGPIREFKADFILRF